MMDGFGRKSYRKLGRDKEVGEAQKKASSVQLGYSASERTGGISAGGSGAESALTRRTPQFVSASVRAGLGLDRVDETGSFALGRGQGQGQSVSYGHGHGHSYGQNQGGNDDMMEAASLLNVGLKEWRERSLSIAMQRSRTVANSGAGSGLMRNPTLTSRSRAADKLRQAVIDATSSVKNRTQLVPGQNGLDQVGPVPTTPTVIDLPPKYYSSLARAPHASLIHVVILYHQILCRNGLTQEADQIASLLEGLQDADNADAAAVAAELQGIDLLLKDGLLKLYLRIQPYLPLVNSQVCFFFVFLLLFLWFIFHCLLVCFGYRSAIVFKLNFIRKWFLFSVSFSTQDRIRFHSFPT